MGHREIRELRIVIPPRTRPEGSMEVRLVTIDVIFADGTGTQLRTGTSIEHWPSGDVLDTVKAFVAELERA